MELINFLPEISEKSEVILMQLMKAKSEMGSAVKKDSANPFHKSKYASLGAHLELCESVLSKHGLLMLHSPNMINNQHMLVATLHHPESGQWIKSYLPLCNPKSDSQGIGASLTYMRRYSINSMLGLNAEDDDGETASGRGKYEKQSPKPNAPVQSSPQNAPSEKIQQAEIVNMSNLTQELRKLDEGSYQSFCGWVKKEFNAEKTSDLPKTAYEKCMHTLNARIKYLKHQERAIA